ncbi:ABC transporter permease [Rhodopila sp.]|uniref:ABC transporter permease n=1 Tax=Rhodopila sp. TaxID=2480087 RepID=UPI002C084561|nr:ABC transporter permease [Rhodopila sp.]HVZ10345.1 ABC transporter permease [Rhodopila sp.]
MKDISWSRFVAMLRKELLQMQRDRATVLMTVAVPLMQLFLFGFAINTNPRHLPTAFVSGDHSVYERAITSALVNTAYFDLRMYTSDEAADQALARGDVLFVLRIPPGFARAVDRGESPTILMQADATDSTAIAAAASALQGIVPGAINRDLPPEMRMAPETPSFRVIIHNRYNPEQITAFNIVPGLVGVVLTFSTLIATTLSITRERETGTMENLLAMPLRPVEVMLGKIVPYIGLGYIQVVLILVAAVTVFQVPLRGSVLLLLLALGLFIACNLAVGFTLSSLAATQMQAQQMAMASLLPSMLLSGFMFPFAGMPAWARTAGDLLPLTHVLRICRGIMLKGNGVAEIVPELWPMALFAVIVGIVAVRSYRQTLD